MTNIEPTASTITIALATDLLTCSDADFLTTLDAHDDASHFAELCIIDARDEPTLIADAHMPTTDSAFDDAIDRILDIMRDDATYASMHEHLTAIINERAQTLRPDDFNE